MVCPDSVHPLFKKRKIKTVSRLLFFHTYSFACLYIFFLCELTPPFPSGRYGQNTIFLSGVLPPVIGVALEFVVAPTFEIKEKLGQGYVLIFEIDRKN